MIEARRYILSTRIGDPARKTCMHCDGRLWIVGEVQSSYWVACDTCDFAGKRWKMHVDPGLRLVIRK